ncbi:MAG: DUF58 domain-containing protein [Chloroflexi bacterium]|nr:DUF58 domain-containing protein [Chloroflexota bacterium]
MTPRSPVGFFFEWARQCAPYWDWVIRVGLALTLLVTPFPWTLFAGGLLLVPLALPVLGFPSRGAVMLGLATILIPAVLWAQVAPLWSALLWGLVAVPGLDRALRGATLPPVTDNAPEGRAATEVFKGVVIALLGSAALSLVTATGGLAVAAGVAAAYLLVIAGVVVRGAPARAVAVEATQVRVMAGESRACEVRLTNRGSIPLEVALALDQPGVSAAPGKIALGDEEQWVRLEVKPWLAGPDTLFLRSYAVDPWRLFLITQRTDAAHVVVVPRAAVAEWLARQFLAGSGNAAGHIASLSRMVGRAKVREEYSHHRLYLPGDTLRDIDWKRSGKFRELLVKEFGGGMSFTTVALADLAADSMEEADKLALDLVATAMTLAQEGIPASLAAFDHRDVVLWPVGGDAREAVRRALQLLPQIAWAPAPARVLDAPEAAWLWKSAGGRGRRSSFGEGVDEFLALELALLHRTAQAHPLGRLVARLMEQTPPPATVALLSRSSANRDVLAWAADRLAQAGYRVIQVEHGESATKAGPAVKIGSLRRVS